MRIQDQMEGHCTCCRLEKPLTEKVITFTNITAHAMVKIYKRDNV